MSEDADQPHRPARGTGREALIDAVIEILTEVGTRGVTYRAVAERAGVTHGLVRYHFRTLAELVRTAVQEWAMTSIGLTDIEPGTGLIDDMGSELPHNVAEQAAEHVSMYELAMTAARSGYLREEMKETYRAYCEAVSRELGRAGFEVEDGVLGSVVFAAIDGLVIQQLLFGDERRLEDGLDRLRGILHVVSKHAPELLAR